MNLDLRTCLFVMMTVVKYTNGSPKVNTRAIEAYLCPHTSLVYSILKLSGSLMKVRILYTSKSMYPSWTKAINPFQIIVLLIDFWSCSIFYFVLSGDVCLYIHGIK